MRVCRDESGRIFLSPEQYQSIKWPYIFNILLYFLSLSKLSYITSQNPIFFQNYEKKVEYIILSGSFIWKWHKDINADSSIVFGWSCIATDTFMWLFYCWIFLGFKFTWLHIYFSFVVFCDTCPFLLWSATQRLFLDFGLDMYILKNNV
jgi:hypothetical protein